MKTNYYNILVLIAIGSFIFGCDNHYFPLEDINTITLDSNSVKTISFNEGGIFDFNKNIDSNSLELISLEQNEKTLLTKVDKMYALDSIFILFDKTLEKVLLYNKVGKLISEISPNEEIRKIFNVSVDYHLNEVLLHDEKKKVIYHFDIEGKLLKKTSVKFLFNDFINSSKNKDFTFISLYDNNHKLNLKFSNSNVFVGEVDKINSYIPNFIADRILEDEYIPNKLLFSSKNTIFYTPIFSNKIYELESDTAFLRYKFDFGKKDIVTHLKGKKTSDFVDLYNTHEFYTFDGQIYKAKEISFFGIQKDGLLGYFYNNTNNTIFGGNISTTLSNQEKSILPSYNFPISSTGEKFVSLIYPPYNLKQGMYIEKTEKFLTENSGSPILLLYNIND